MGLDAHLLSDLYGGVEFVRRELKVPVFDIVGDATEVEHQRQDVSSVYLYWAPHPRWAFGARYEYEEIKQKETQFQPGPEKLETMTVPLTVRYFDPLGFFAVFGTSYLRQKVHQPLESDHGTEDVVLLDAAVGYRLPKRLGVVSLEVNNVLNQDFNYEDINFFTNEVRNPQFIPERTILAKATLNF